MSTTLFETLKDAIGERWAAYTQHDFLIQLGQGTLPLPAFQDYLVQDYLFLIQFARANALAIAKSRDLAMIRQSHQSLSTVLAETDLHRRLTERWGIVPAELDAASEKDITVAYTRYVLDIGHSGDLLDLNVALAPCTIGYAEIGRALAPQLGNRPDHPYREWVEEYAGAEFQAAARATIDRLDTLAGPAVGGRRLAELVQIFDTATRLEAAFWQQALTA